MVFPFYSIFSILVFYVTIIVLHVFIYGFVCSALCDTLVNVASLNYVQFAFSEK